MVDTQQSIGLLATRLPGSQPVESFTCKVQRRPGFRFARPEFSGAAAFVGGCVQLDLGQSFQGFEETLGQVVEAAVKRALDGLACLPAQSAQSGEYLTMVEATALARNKSGKTVSAWIRKGLLRGYGEGRRRRVKRCELIAFLENPRPSKAPIKAEEIALAILARGRK